MVTHKRWQLPLSARAARALMKAGRAEGYPRISFEGTTPDGSPFKITFDSEQSEAEDKGNELDAWIAKHAL